MLFIIIHQVYELWFKEVLHELDELVEHLDDDRPSLGGHQLKRVLKIFKTLVSQLDVLETMTPLEFTSFRSFLANGQRASSRPSSGSWSSCSARRIRSTWTGSSTSPGSLERLQRRRSEEPSLWDALRPVPRAAGLVRHPRRGARP